MVVIIKFYSNQMKQRDYKFIQMNRWIVVAYESVPRAYWMHNQIKG